MVASIQAAMGTLLLVWGRFCVWETIIPDAQEHFLTPSARRDTHLIGGLGLRPRKLAGNPDSPQAVIFLASITDVMMGS